MLLKTLQHIAIVATAVALLFSSKSWAQCGQDIDLNTWVKEGVPANGNWNVNTGGTSVTQTINGEPTFYVSPDSFINVVITGDIQVQETSDDDWIGFVFAYESPDTVTPSDYDFLIFAWKQGDQTFSGFQGYEGYTLAKVQGPVTNLPQAFCAFAGPYVDVIGSQYSNTSGWVDFTTYSFELTYTNTRTVIAINGDTLFDVYGCYVPGRFGFYNYSQSQVQYSNFQYRVAAAFEVVTPDVCVGDTARFIALSDSCPSMPGAQVNNTIVGWEWDLGDGTISFDTNATHVYDSAGVYTVSLIVTDYIGCKDTAYNTVTIYGVDVDLGPDTAICSNENITLTPAGSGISFLWNDASTGASLMVNSPGTYVVTATGANSCTVVDSIVVTDIPAPFVDLGNDTSICNSDSIWLVATYPGATYLWSTGSTNDSIGLNAVGEYLVTVFEGVCSDTDSIAISHYAAPTISPPDPSLCYGDTLTISATGADTYQWFPAAGLSATTGSAVQTFTLTSTVYTIVGTDTNGCIDTAQFNVTVTPLPTANFSGGGDICQGDSIQLTATLSGTAPWTLTYSDGSSNTTLTGLTQPIQTFYSFTSGVYHALTISDSGCANMLGDSTEVIVHSLPTPGIVSDSADICRGQFTALHASGGQTYQWANTAGLSGLTGANVVASPDTTTEYGVWVTDSNNCSDSAFVIVVVHALPTLVLVTSDDTVCKNESAVLTASGAVNYYWNNTPGLSAYTGTPITATPLVSSTYTAIAVDANGCRDTQNIAIAVDTLPIIFVVPGDTSICLNKSTPLEAFGAFTYQWSPSALLDIATGDSVNTSNLVTTTYGVTGTDANGCIGDTTVTVTIDPLPVLTISPPDPEICFGFSEVLTVSGAVAYQWDTIAGLNTYAGATVTANPTATTTYTVTGTDANGCSQTSSSELVVNPLPVLDITPDTAAFCFGGNTNISVTGAFQYTWKNTPGLSTYLGSNVNAQPTVTSTYEVVGTDVNGCKDSVQALIIVHPLPVLSIAPPAPSICFGSQVALSATGASTYAWPGAAGLSSINGGNAIAAPTTTSSYTVTGTDANNCVSTASVQVTVLDLPVITLSSSEAIACTQQPNQLVATGAATYQWSPQTNMIGGNTPAPIVTPVSTTTYYVTATGANGCTTTGSIEAEVYPIPNYSAGNSTKICAGDTGQLNASGGVSYAWSPSIGLSATDVPDPLVSIPFTRTYVVTIMDVNGCEFIDDVRVRVNPLPPARSGGDKRICLNDQVQIGGSPTSDPGNTYLWSPAAGLGNVNDPNPWASPAQTTEYSVVVTDDEGCQKTTSMTVTVDSLPEVEILERPDYLCYNSSSTVRVTEGLASYRWVPEEGVKNPNKGTTVFSPTATYTYTLYVTDAQGCTNSVEMPLTVMPLPRVRTIDFYEMCEGDTAELWARGAITYRWTDGSTVSDSTSDTVTAFPTVSTRYLVRGTDSLGCVGRDSVYLVVHTRPEIDAGDDISNCDMNIVLLGGSPTGPLDATYTWTPDSLISDPHAQNPQVLDPERTMYYLHAVSPYGCESVDSVLVDGDCEDHIYAPNTFTPDADALMINETFLISFWQVRDMHLVIFDRFGKLIFETTDPLQGWDGLMPDGYPAPIGVYFWRVEYHTITGRAKSAENTITLLR